MFTKFGAYLLKWAHSWIFWWQIQCSINFISHGAFNILQRSCSLCTNTGCGSLFFKILFVLYVSLLDWNIYLDYFFQLSLEFSVAMWLSLAKGMCYMLIPVLAHTNFPCVILHGLSPSLGLIPTAWWLAAAGEDGRDQRWKESGTLYYFLEESHSFLTLSEKLNSLSFEPLYMLESVITEDGLTCLKKLAFCNLVDGYHNLSVVLNQLWFMIFGRRGVVINVNYC